MMLSQNRHAILTQCLAQGSGALAQTEHFTVYKLKPGQQAPVQEEDLIVVHNFDSSEIDNNIGYYVVSELLPALAELHETHQILPTDHAYALSEQRGFERYVGDIVRSVDGNETRAWHNFYDNTLDALTKAANHYIDTSVYGSGQSGSESIAIEPHQDFISNFGAIYQCALELFDISQPPESLTVLDAATCFGFFPLFIAHRQLLAHRQQTSLANCSGLATIPGFVNVVGCDLNPALVDLANSYAQRRQLDQVRFVVSDVLATDHRGIRSSMVPFDVVTAIHLLEHLEPHQTETAIANLWKITGRRLIISVPLEEKPDKQFGHLQVFDPTRLSALAQQLSASYRYFEYRGGWIVIDRPPTKPHSPKRKQHHAEISY